MSEGWPRFVELAQELDAVRAEEVARTGGLRASVAEMSEHADQLEARLNGQRGMLTSLAGELRLRGPKFAPLVPEGQVDPATSLATIEGAIDRGDREARQAAERGQYAGILPGLTPLARSLAVYGVAALVILALQLPQWASLIDVGTGKTAPEDGPDPILTLFLIPAIVFAVAYAVLRLGVRTRMDTPKQRPRTRLGFLLCFAVGPLGLLAFAVIGWRQG
jgi:hypothetical protein